MDLTGSCTVQGAAKNHMKISSGSRCLRQSVQPSCWSVRQGFGPELLRSQKTAQRYPSGSDPKFTDVAFEKFGRYTFRAAAKSAAGIGVPDMTIAHNRAYAVFLCVKHCYISIMVGRAGQPKGWPVPMVAGNANSVRLTTPEIGVSSGELSKLTIEADIMSTFPTPGRFVFLFRAIRLSNPDAEPVVLHSVANTERQARAFHEPHYSLELICKNRIAKTRRPRIIRGAL